MGCGDHLGVAIDFLGGTKRASTAAAQTRNKMPHSTKSSTDAHREVARERTCARAYLLYSRGRGAERYLSSLEGRQAPRLLDSKSSNLPRRSPQVFGDMLTVSLGIAE